MTKTWSGTIRVPYTNAASPLPLLYPTPQRFLQPAISLHPSAGKLGMSCNSTARQSTHATPPVSPLTTDQDKRVSRRVGRKQLKPRPWYENLAWQSVVKWGSHIKLPSWLSTKTTNSSHFYLLLLFSRIPPLSLLHFVCEASFYIAGSFHGFWILRHLQFIHHIVFLQSYNTIFS